MNFQLPTKDEKADYVLKQFDRIAKKYDLANDLISLGMHRLWKARAIKELIGDNACGSCTGCGAFDEMDLANAFSSGSNAANCPTDAKQHSASKSGAATACPETKDLSNATSNELIELALKNKGPKKYLDVCTGTGDLALSLFEDLHYRGEVTGLDFSPEMLGVARQRCEQAFGANPNLKWVQGDAQNLPFENDTFDGAIISFGLRNLTDLQKGLDEMSRVVKPGGKVINLDLGQPTMPVFTPLFLFFFDQIVPIIGELIQQDRQAYTYLPESRKTYPHPEQLSRMFMAAGMTDVSWLALAMGSVAMHVGTVQ